ncbi:acyltransferase [Mesorhizobium sp. WSM4904]|uniref:acyltransferase family protein n=1 Tax=Mesorhizobium sp. WSM4904 TaxID=3038545 RepID=UPI002418333D|nr:acyltransferase [Mesorhizobium sp. WSM4904]WFP61152.1 acyltransferase [Mesorhizobium sp. WSM4904]
MHRRYVTLDLLRGIAAIGVMLFHNCVDVVPSGYLAVDLFFVLSGFVIALSYEDKLRGGLAQSAFFLARFIRLWPMIVVGSVLGLLAGLAHYTAHPGDLWTLGAQFSGSLILLPKLAIAEGDELFPLNTVFWSLFFEVVVNVIYAAWLYSRRAQGLLIAVVIVSAICILLQPEIRMLMLFARALLGFFLGVLVYRMSKKLQWTAVRFGWLFCAAGVVLILAMPTSIRPPGILFLLTDAVFCAIILVAAASDEKMPSKSVGWSQWLGDISYPLYAIHRPLFYFCSLLIVRATHDLAAYNLAAFVASIAIVAASGVVLRSFDQPVRRYLTGLTRPYLKTKGRPEAAFWEA